MSTSVTKNRLLHISDLPYVRKFTANDINKLLPVHFNTLRDNVLTMLHYETPNFKQKVLVHDPNLTVNSTNYTQVKGGWCEDFDQKEDVSSVSCIKKSIEVGVIILNYLQAMCNAQIKHRDTLTQDDPKILFKGQCFTRTMKPSPSQSYPQLLKDTLRRQHQPYNNSQLSYLPMQHQSQCLMKQSNLVIAYNIYKKNKNYIFITGVNQCYTDNFVSLISLFREWNLGRLKIEDKLGLSFEKMFRASAYLQHLFSIARGFIFSSFRSLQANDPFLPLNDLNDTKKHLKHLLSYFPTNKQLQNESQLIFSKFKQQQFQTFGSFDDTFKLYRFCFTYKLESDLAEEKEGLVVKFKSYMGKVLGRVLAQVPINITVSYCVESHHDENANQLVLLMLINYKSHLSKHIFLSSQQIGLVNRNLSSYLNHQHYQKVRRAQRNIADQVFKSSYLIFNKYNQQIVDNRHMEKLAQSKSNTMMVTGGALSQKSSAKDLMRLNNSMSVSRVSYSNSNINANSSNIKMNLRPLMTDKKVQSQKSTIFTKSTRLSEVETEYKKLLRSLQQRQEVNCLLNPIQLRKILKQYLLPYTQTQTSYSPQKSEKASIQFLALSCQMLSAQDIYHLLIKFQDSQQCLCEYFMQEGNFEKIVQVGKLLSPAVVKMFKEYLNVNRGFTSFRYSRVVAFLKKVLQKYYLQRQAGNKLKLQNKVVLSINSYNNSSTKQQQSQSPSKHLSQSQHSLNPNTQPQHSHLNLRQLHIQDLILLLQSKSPTCRQYSLLLQQYMPDIFTSRPQTQYISSILYHYYITLLNNDHHQDLAAAFIADLFYEIVYFTQQLTTLTLTNSRYRKNVTDLKEKKFYQLIRDVGFFHHGLNAKGVLIPTLINAKQIIIYQQLIVRTIVISKPQYFRSVIKMIQNSFFSDNFTLLSKQITKKYTHFEALSRQIAMPIYNIQTIQQANKLRVNNQIAQQKGQQQQQQQQHQQQPQDPLVNIDISESGIFRDLLSLNPNVRIAGMSLKQEYSRIMIKKEQQERRLTVGYLLGKVLKLQVEQHWEYIQLASQLKTKFREMQHESYRMSVNMDPSKQADLLYLKETLQQIYSQLSGVYEYLALSDVVFQIGRMMINPHVQTVSQ